MIKEHKDIIIITMKKLIFSINVNQMLDANLMKNNDNLFYFCIHFIIKKKILPNSIFFPFSSSNSSLSLLQFQENL